MKTKSDRLYFWLEGDNGYCDLYCIFEGTVICLWRAPLGSKPIGPVTVA